jgi:hypothetical protein
MPPVYWFTDQVLAPRPDWYRPDLAAQRVQQLTRSFRVALGGGGQVVGINNKRLRPGQQVEEILTYDARGYLLRYQLVAAPARKGHSAQTVENLFSYDAQQRLRQIQVKGTRQLVEVEDFFSSKAYSRWRDGKGFRQLHRLPARSEMPTLFPLTWQLRQVQLRYDAQGRPQPARAIVALMAQAHRRREVQWTDTVRLDPRRDWHLATADTLAGFADTAWHRVSDTWWQLRIPMSSRVGLRVQQLPLSSRMYSEYPNDALYGLSSFFDPAGRLLLVRVIGDGTVWRHSYDAQGQPRRREAYLMHLPNRYGDTLYFGGIGVVMAIPDCERQQRWAFPLPDGQQAVRELQWTQQVRYAGSRRGLPRRAIVQTTKPYYTVDVSFNGLLHTKRPVGHDGPYRKVPHWRHVRAQLQQRQQAIADGCVPMKLTTADTQVIRLHYRYFPVVAGK